MAISARFLIVFRHAARLTDGTPLFSPGGACVHAAGMIAGNSAAASETVRPGDSRPTIVSVVQSAASESLHHRYPTRSIIVGIYRFTGIGVRATGCGGAMPMTVNATPLIVITEPTASGLPPNHDCQKSYPMTTTRSRSGTRSSSARKKRPSSGLHPEKRKVIRRDDRAVDLRPHCPRPRRRAARSNSARRASSPSSRDRETRRSRDMKSRRQSEDGRALR